MCLSAYFQSEEIVYISEDLGNNFWVANKFSTYERVLKCVLNVIVGPGSPFQTLEGILIDVA